MLTNNNTDNSFVLKDQFDVASMESAKEEYKDAMQILSNLEKASGVLFLLEPI